MAILRGRWSLLGALLAASLFFSSPAIAGYRLQVRVVPLNAPAGEPSMDGAEVCIYHAGDPSDFFSKFFHSDEVRCYPAEKILDMPAGTFLLSAHVADRFVSIAPYLIDVTVPDEEVLRRYVVEVVPAATLDFAAVRNKVPDGTYPAVYFPNNSYPRFVANALPLPRGSATMLIPAEQTIVPMLVGGDRIHAVGEPVSVATGQRRALEANAFSSRDATVVALVRLQNFGDRLPAPQLEPLRAELTPKTEGSLLPAAPALPPRGEGLFDRSLLIFRDVRRGDYRLRLDGDLWKPDEIDLQVEGNGVIQVARPLVAEPASVLAIQWTAEGVGSTFLQPRACSGSHAEPQLSVGWKLASCVIAADAERPCTPIKTDELPLTSAQGRFTASRLPAGDYEAELAVNGVRVWKERITLGAAERRSTAARFALRTIHGNVRQGASGVRAQVAFASGAGVSEESGEFVAVLAQPIRAHTPVDVVACDGSFSFTAFVDRDLDDGDRFDVDVPSGALRVEVTSAGVPLAGAKVTVGVLMPDSDEAAMAILAFPPTDGEGRSEKRMLEEGRRYRACATHAGYNRVCSEPIVLGEEPSSIRISLTPAGTHEGRLVSEKPFLGARVAFVDAQGNVREDVAVAPDGSFTSQQVHSAPEFAVLTSLSHPLAVIGLPVMTDERLELPLPSGPVTSFDVRLSPSRAAAVITLQIGTAIVPWTLVDRYLGQSGGRAVLRDGRAAHFAGVLESLPVFVVAAPSVLPPYVPLDALFHRPEAGQFPRLSVDGGVVTVE